MKGEYEMSTILAFPMALISVLTLWTWNNAKGSFRARINKLLSFYGKVFVGVITLLIYSVLIFGAESMGQTIVMFL